MIDIIQYLKSKYSIFFPFVGINEIAVFLTQTLKVPSVLISYLRTCTEVPEVLPYSYTTLTCDSRATVQHCQQQPACHFEGIQRRHGSTILLSTKVCTNTLRVQLYTYTYSRRQSLLINRLRVHVHIPSKVRKYLRGYLRRYTYFRTFVVATYSKLIRLQPYSYVPVHVRVRGLPEVILYVPSKVLCVLYLRMFFTRKTWFFAHYPIVVVYTALQYKSPIKLGFDREGLRPLSPELALMRQS